MTESPFRSADEIDVDSYRSIEGTDFSVVEVPPQVLGDVSRVLGFLECTGLPDTVMPSKVTQIHVESLVNAPWVQGVFAPDFLRQFTHYGHDHPWNKDTLYLQPIGSVSIPPSKPDVRFADQLASIRTGPLWRGKGRADIEVAHYYTSNLSKFQPYYWTHELKKPFLVFFDMSGEQY